MADPRLNSLHLPAARRDQFRRAREDVLRSQGPETAYLERQALSSPNEHTTAIHQEAGVLPLSRFVLMGKDYIYPLKIGLNTVGRMPDNDVVVADPYVSRRHVAIMVHAAHGCVLHDVASKNGTLLNGQPLRGPTPLKPGDRIQLSDHQLIFLTRNDAPDCLPAQVTQAE